MTGTRAPLAPTLRRLMVEPMPMGRRALPPLGLILLAAVGRDLPHRRGHEPMAVAERRARLLAGRPAAAQRRAAVRPDRDLDHPVCLLVSAGRGPGRRADQRGRPVRGVQLGLDRDPRRLPDLAGRRPAARRARPRGLRAGRDRARLPQRPPHPGGARRAGDPALAGPLRGRRRDQDRAGPGHRRTWPRGVDGATR